MSGAMDRNDAREYEMILLGATGYTGKLCAEYITYHLPTDLKWAIAGRSSPKLSNLFHDLVSLNSDRSGPSKLVYTLFIPVNLHRRQVSKSLH